MPTQEQLDRLREERDALDYQYSEVVNKTIPMLESQINTLHEEVAEWKKRFGDLKTAREKRGDTTQLELQVERYRVALREIASGDVMAASVVIARNALGGVKTNGQCSDGSHDGLCGCDQLDPPSKD